MSPEILSNTDRTSWQRIAMVWRFYLPYTRKKLIGFALIGFVISGLILYALDYMPEQLSVSVVFMLSFMIVGLFSFSGLVFAKPKGRELQTLLPALGMERAIVIIGYVTTVIPLVLWVPSLFYLFFTSYSETAAKACELFGLSLSPSLFLFSVLMLESMALSCLWAVLASKRRHAIRNGVLSALGFYFAVSFMSGFISGLIAGLNGYSEDFLSTHFDTIYTILAGICGIYIIFALIKCCRIIKHGI